MERERECECAYLPGHVFGKNGVGGPHTRPVLPAQGEGDGRHRVRTVARQLGVDGLKPNTHILEQRLVIAICLHARTSE